MESKNKKEYRLDESTGTVSEKQEWMKRYKTSIFTSTKRLERLWNQLTLIPTEEMTDVEMEEMKERLNYIFKPDLEEYYAISAMMTTGSYSAVNAYSSAHTTSC